MVKFDVRDKFKKNNLLGKSLSVPEDPSSAIGSSGIEIFADGETQGYKVISRQISQAWFLNLETVKELQIVLDNQNNGDFWSYVEISVVQ
jgi:hypothetical protein